MGCGASVARREQMAVEHTYVQRRASLGLELGMPTYSQRSRLGSMSAEQRAQVTEVLRELPIFAHASDRELAAVVRHRLAPPWWVSHGTSIVSEGAVPALVGPLWEPIDGMFVVLSGEAQASKRRYCGVQDLYLHSAGQHFGEGVLCGYSSRRAATVRAVGDLQICHITRQVWQKLFTAATARAAAEHTLELRLQEYALLLEGHHPELAAELALELQSFALDHGLSSPDLPEPALGSPKRTAARDSGQHAGSVRVVSRQELKARRASVGELSPAFSAASAARRKSVSVKLRCVLVALFCSARLRLHSCGCLWCVVLPLPRPPAPTIGAQVAVRSRTCSRETANRSPGGGRIDTVGSSVGSR